MISPWYKSGPIKDGANNYRDVDVLRYLSEAKSYYHALYMGDKTNIRFLMYGIHISFSLWIYLVFLHNTYLTWCSPSISGTGNVSYRCSVIPPLYIHQFVDCIPRQTLDGDTVYHHGPLLPYMRYIYPPHHPITTMSQGVHGEENCWSITIMEG